MKTTLKPALIVVIFLVVVMLIALFFGYMVKQNKEYLITTNDQSSTLSQIDAETTMEFGQHQALLTLRPQTTSPTATVYEVFLSAQDVPLVGISVRLNIANPDSMLAVSQGFSLSPEIMAAGWVPAINIVKNQLTTGEITVELALLNTQFEGLVIDPALPIGSLVIEKLPEWQSGGVSIGFDTQETKVIGKDGTKLFVTTQVETQ